MSRNQLHITKLDEFTSFLDAQGIDHRAGKGAYEVLQVRLKAGGFGAVYRRHEMPEHYSVDRRLESLVARFCRQRKQESRSDG